MDVGEYLDMTYTFHADPMGEQFVRCEYCRAEESAEIGGVESIAHSLDCLRPSLW